MLFLFYEKLFSLCSNNEKKCFSVFLTFVNCYNVKWSTRITDGVAFAKVIALVIIIFAGITHLAYGKRIYFISTIPLLLPLLFLQR